MALPDYSGQYGSGSMFTTQTQTNTNGRGSAHVLAYGGRSGGSAYGPLPHLSSPSQPTPPPSPPPVSPPPPPMAPPPPPANPSSYQPPQPPLNPGPYTFGSGSLDNPFYDPNATYIPEGYRGATPSMWNTAGSPNPLTLGNQYAEDNPEAYYYGLLNQQGFGGLDARSRAAQSMYADFARGYQAAKFTNPELTWAQFASQQNVPNLIQSLSDSQLGINDGQNRGPINWTLRG